MIGRHNGEHPLSKLNFQFYYNYMIYILLLFLLSLIVWAIVDNESGCLKVFFFFSATLGVILGIIWLQRSCQSPKISEWDVVETKHGKTYTYSCSSYKCPSGRTHYSVEKTEPTEPNRKDTCLNCGKMFYLHQKSKTFEKEQSDQIYLDKITETPAY